MLGKLIKYDLKAMNRYLIIIHGFLLLASAAIRLFLTGPMLSAETNWGDPSILLPLSLFVIIYILLIAAGNFATSIVIVVRFYKNLFSEQGYLTRTLPVTSGQHLLAKTISGMIWSLLNTIITALSIIIVFGTPFITTSLKENMSVIREDLGLVGPYANMTWTTLLTIFALITLIGVFCNVVTYYASVVFGQLIPNHKVLGALAAYFVITTVATISSLLALALFGLLGSYADSRVGYSGIHLFLDTSKISCILSIGFTVILYVATYWIMKKKINLD